MKRISIAILLLICGFCVGCAGGSKFEYVEAQTPPPAADQGRIYFYRDNTPVGMAIQPPIYLNGQAVGKSQPGGYFYVDQPAGEYKALCSTEADHALTFTLRAQEKRYVRTILSMGLFVGQVHPVLVDETTALKALKSCKYIGQPPQQTITATK